MDASAVRYNKIECKSLLNKSGISDYTVNCYSGCAHACVYCYARFATRFTHPREDWGTFVDIKVNAPQVLAREVKRKPAGHVILSSVCDGWQPMEKSSELTRQCLEILVRYRFSISVLTKSALAVRDLDIMQNGDVEVGVTLTTLDAGLAALFEPGASPPEKRLEVLQSAKSKGLKTTAFLGPLIPFLSDSEESITALLKTVKDLQVDGFYMDKLNLRYGVWPSLSKLLAKHYPALLPEYRKIFFNNAAKADYIDILISRINNLTRKLGVDDKINLII